MTSLQIIKRKKYLQLIETELKNFTLEFTAKRYFFVDKIVIKDLYDELDNLLKKKKQSYEIYWYSIVNLSDISIEEIKLKIYIQYDPTHEPYPIEVKGSTSYLL